ncbi:MAG: sterol carrier protein domain-containing protein, partial [Tepidiformaceae bacterium]
NSLVQYEEDGAILGYVMYRTRAHDTLGVPDGTVAVTELLAETDAAYSALWQFVFGIDLIATIEAPYRRVNEPLGWMLTDPRHLHRAVYDTLWLRLVELPAALAGRCYLSEGSLVISVSDQFCPWNNGSYLLEGGPSGATCTPTTRTADVELNANDLGAAYLGGVRFETLARANRVTGSAQALRLADRMFQWDCLPWELEVF